MILLDKLLDYYGKPDSPHPENFLAIYRNEFAAVPEDQQEAVALHVIRTQTRWGRTWPTVPEIEAAVKAVKSQRERGIADLPPVIENFDQWFAGLCREMQAAKSFAAIDNIIGKLEPYHEGKLCLPWRMARLTELGAERTKALKIAGARNPAGVDA